MSCRPPDLVGFDWGGTRAAWWRALWPERVRCWSTANGYASRISLAAARRCRRSRRYAWYNTISHRTAGPGGTAGNRLRMGQSCCGGCCGSPNWKFDEATSERTPSRSILSGLRRCRHPFLPTPLRLRPRRSDLESDFEQTSHRRAPGDQSTDDCAARAATMASRGPAKPGEQPAVTAPFSTGSFQ